jgi:hypothetical protein
LVATPLRPSERLAQLLGEAFLDDEQRAQMERVRAARAGRPPTRLERFADELSLWAWDRERARFRHDFKASRVLERVQARFGALSAVDAARIRAASDDALTAMWDQLEQAHSLNELLEGALRTRPEQHEGT